MSFSKLNITNTFEDTHDNYFIPHSLIHQSLNNKGTDFSKFKVILHGLEGELRYWCAHSNQLLHDCICQLRFTLDPRADARAMMNTQPS